MKPLIAIALVLAIHLPLQAQKACTDSSVHYRYAFSDSAVIYKQIPAKSGGSILMGQFKSAAYSEETFIVRLNEKDDVIWSKRIASTIRDGGFETIAEAGNGNIVLTGTLGSSNMPFKTLVLSPEGDIINQHQVGFKNIKDLYLKICGTDLIVNYGMDSLLMFFSVGAGYDYENVVTIDNAGNIGSVIGLIMSNSEVSVPSIRKAEIKGDSIAIYGACLLYKAFYFDNMQHMEPFMMKMNLKTKEVGTRKVYGMPFDFDDMVWKHKWEYVGGNMLRGNFFPQKNGNVILAKREVVLEPNISDSVLRLWRLSTFDAEFNHLHSEFVYTDNIFNKYTGVTFENHALEEIYIDSVGNKRFSFHDVDNQVVYYALADADNNFFLQKKFPFPSAKKYQNWFSTENDINDPDCLASFNIMSFQNNSNLAIDHFKILPQDTAYDCFGSNTSFLTIKSPAVTKLMSAGDPVTTIPVILETASVNFYSVKDYAVKQDIICAVGHICDTLKTHAPEAWCESTKPLTITAYKNPLCAGKVLFSFDTASASAYKQLNDTTLTLWFNKSWNGKIYTTLSTCSVIKDSVSVLYAPHKQLNIGNDTLFCPGHVYTLNAGTGFKNYVWQDNSTDSIFTAVEPGRYFVTAKDDCGALLTDTIKISNSELVLKAESDTTICEGETVMLTATKGFNNYVWTPGYDISNPRSATIEVSPVKTTSYVVNADLFNGCTVADTVTVTTNYCPQQFFIPNAFTPNNDGINDSFKPVVTGVLKNYEFSIYNRYGEKIFQSTNLNKGWDGSYKNVLQPAGTYIWTCRYQFYKQSIQTKKGIVLLIK